MAVSHDANTRTCRIELYFWCYRRHCGSLSTACRPGKFQLMDIAAGNNK